MDQRPNILLLIMDSVRADHLACYGYSRLTTPNLDRLAAEGTLFLQAIAEGCWTLPVHTSLFTGLFPHSHGVTISRDALAPDVATLARRLTDGGYQTACFSNNAYISAATGLTQGFATSEDIWRSVKPRGMQRGKLSRLIRWLDSRGALAHPLLLMAHGARRVRAIIKSSRRQRDQGARRTNDRIRQWLTSAWRRERPFFIFVNYMECHERYSPPAPYDRRFMPAHLSPARVAQASPFKTKILADAAAGNTDDLEIVRALYDGALCYLDSQIGALVGHLRSLGILDHTLVVVASDHGDSLGEHGHLGHRLALYDQLVRVPLIVRYPERFPAGRRVPHPVQLGDLHPTCLELAGAEVGAEAASGLVSLMGSLDGPRHPFTVAENTAPKALDSVVSQMLRAERYKLIWRSDGRHELYDLSSDREERINLITDQPDVAGRMFEQLEAWRRRLEGQRLVQDQADYDEVILQRLQALGYVE